MQTKIIDAVPDHTSLADQTQAQEWPAGAKLYLAILSTMQSQRASLA